MNNMIDVRELRVGSLIQWKSTGDIESVLKINNAGKHAIINDVQVTDIKPIPITEEWLKKLGFTLSNVHYLIWYKEGVGAFRILFDVHLKHWQVGLSGGRVIRQVKYIHDLQNIYFALTEKELTL